MSELLLEIFAKTEISKIRHKIRPSFENDDLRLKKRKQETKVQMV